MQQPDKIKHLHWICGNYSIDNKIKLNLAELYSAGVSSLNEENRPVHSCIDDGIGRLSFELKGPYVYYLYSPLEQEPKNLALDVFFKEPVTVAKIRFQNHYVAYLTLMAKVVNHRSWEMLIHHRQLMNYTHCETGSRKYFELESKSLLSWENVTELRFILHQPSPCWKKFYIENISIYRERKKDLSGKNYLTALIKQTETALKMERRNEAKSSSTSGNIPFQIGTCGYEIDKLPKF